MLAASVLLSKSIGRVVACQSNSQPEAVVSVGLELASAVPVTGSRIVLFTQVLVRSSLLKLWAQKLHNAP